jgi:hypothetical protein
MALESPASSFDDEQAATHKASAAAAIGPTLKLTDEH